MYTDYSDIEKSSIREAFEIVMKKSPTILSLIPIAVDRYAQNHKHEWLEHSQAPQSWTVNGASALAAAAVTLDSNTGVEVNDILRFETSAGASVSVKVRVTAVNGNGTEISVTRLGVDAEIPDNAVAYLVARPKETGSDESIKAGTAPTNAYNFTQIFRQDFALTRSQLQTAMRGLATEAERLNKEYSLIDFATTQALQSAAWELAGSVIYGHREERSNSLNGSMGGILHYMAEKNATLDAGANAITAAIINNAVEAAGADGALGGSLDVLVAHPTQARKISAFNTVNNQPQIQQGSVQAGSYVARFQSDLGGSNGGQLSTIVVDRNFPKDKVALINSANLEIVPMSRDLFKRTQTSDYRKDSGDRNTYKVLGELTMEVRNAETMRLIENLTI